MKTLKGSSNVSVPPCQDDLTCCFKLIPGAQFHWRFRKNKRRNKQKRKAGDSRQWFGCSSLKTNFFLAQMAAGCTESEGETPTQFALCSFTSRIWKIGT